MKKKYQTSAKVWLWPGDTPWHFVSLDKESSADIKEKYGTQARGFGSFPVQATILKRGDGQVGKTTWKTSIFPDRKRYIYMLPIKADVRRKEGIFDGDTVTFAVELKI